VLTAAKFLDLPLRAASLTSSSKTAACGSKSRYISRARQVARQREASKLAEIVKCMMERSPIRASKPSCKILVLATLAAALIPSFDGDPVL